MHSALLNRNPPPKTGLAHSPQDRKLQLVLVLPATSIKCPIWRIAILTQVTQFKDRVDKLLSRGMRDLSLTLGVLARIENDTYEIIAVQSNSGAYVRGEKYALGKQL